MSIYHKSAFHQVKPLDFSMENMNKVVEPFKSQAIVPVKVPIRVLYVSKNIKKKKENYKVSYFSYPLMKILKEKKN